jgi:hypothetical protein
MERLAEENRTVAGRGGGGEKKQIIRRIEGYKIGNRI